jgi:quercetin dioxygenase-like cupin family protein
MAGQGVVVPPGPETDPNERSIILKLLGGATRDSIMMFEEIVPPGTKSTYHLHNDSDEVGYVLSGEVTFMIGEDVSVGGPGTLAFIPRGVAHCWKSTGTESGKVLFLYTPANAGRLIEEQRRTGRKFADMSESELAEFLDRHGWKVIGPSPL